MLSEMLSRNLSVMLSVMLSNLSGQVLSPWTGCLRTASGQVPPDSIGRSRELGDCFNSH